MKRLEKRLNKNYSGILRALLNKSSKQLPINHMSLISQNIPVR